MTSTEPRMTAAERRERILAAAAVVFGSRGYHGATTDLVARAAGISQPYVVRLFGTKEALFLAVLDDARATVLGAFRDVLHEARSRGAVDPAAVVEQLGARYIAIARERGVHESLMQGFLLGADPAIGPAGRAGYVEIWRFLRREADLDAETARAFLAHGMLVNVLLGLDLPTRTAGDPDAEELVLATCGADGARLLRD